MDPREKSPGLSFSSKEETANRGDDTTGGKFRWKNLNVVVGLVPIKIKRLILTFCVEIR